MNKLLLKSKVYYGWIIVLAGFLIMATAWAIIFNCASIFVKPISDEFGFKRSYVSAIVTLSMFSQTIISVVSGKIFSKINIKRLMRISSVVISVSYFMYSLADSLLEFYAITIVASVSAAFLTTLPLSLIINNWFSDKKGLAIGFAFMGSGVGGMLFNALAGILMEVYGFRFAYMSLAVIMGIVIIPCVFFIIEIHPRDVYTEASYYEENKSQVIDYDDGITLQEARKTYKFWILMICFIVGSIGMATTFFTISPHMSDSGYSLATSANITALTMGVLAVSKLALGRMFDRFGVRTSSILSILLNVVGLVGLLFAKYKIFLIFIVLGTGFGSAFSTIAFPIITDKLYGQKDFSNIYGLFCAASSIGGVAAPIINGVVFDMTGSYNYSYIFMLIVSVVLILIYNIILPGRNSVQN